MAKSRFASCSNFGTVNNKTSTNKKSRYSSVGILGSVSDKAAEEYRVAKQKELDKEFNNTFLNILKPENGRLPNADITARKMGYRNDTERQEYKKNNPEIYEAMGGIKCIGDSEKVLTNNLFQTNELKQLAKERLINRFNNADITELSKIIDTLNSGEWQKADTMKKYSEKVNTYVNDYIALNELGYFNSVPEAERNEYRDILKNIKDNVQNYKDVFGEYEDAESYKKAQSEAYQKMPTTDTVALQKEIDELNDDYNELVKLQRMRKAEHKSQIKSIQELSYRDWGKLLSDEEAEAEIADNKILLYYDEKINKLLGDYANANDMKQALLEKKAYKTEVEREQKRIEIIQSLTNDALADVEFKKISTFKSKLKYDESGLNVRDVDDLILEYIHGDKKLQGKITMSRRGALALEHGLDSSNDRNMYDWSVYGYDQLNEEEKKIATYYYKTNIEKFWEYLDANEFTWKNRGAKKLAEKMDNVFLGKTLTAIASANDRFVQSMVGIGNYITGNETYVEPTFAQLTSQYVRENLDGFDAFLYDAVDNFAYMTPSILMNAVLPGSGFVVTGISAAGNAYNEGINMGMSVNQARTYGTLIGVSEAGLESLISGIGGLTGKLTGIGIEKVVAGINSGIIKFVATLGINSISEGFEEFSQELLEPLFENIALGYSKNDWDDIDWDAAVYSGLLGAFMGGVSNVLPSAVKVSFDSINANVIYGSSIDSIKGLLQNGFAMPKDSVAYGQALKVESQLNNGKKLSGTTLYNLAAAIKSEIETKSTDRLAELGENKKIIKELSPVIAKTVFGEQLTSYDVYALKKSQYGNQVVKELSADRVNTIWRNAVENSRVGNSKNMQNAELHSDAYNYNNNDIYLSKSNGGETKQGQPFNIDLSQVKLKYQDTYKRAIESGYFNNTQQTHDFIEMLAEISADKGINFEFTDNEKVNNSSFAIKEKAVNGYVTRGTITLNVNSAKPFNSLVGHEITHVLERTRNFGDLNSLILKYAKQKGDYESRLAALTELYENAEGADVNKELVADLVGDYLFTDIDFVRRLFNENRNLFQRIYDEIMYLYRIVAAGSIEELQLEIIKKTFEEVYRESENVEKNTADDVGVSYSVAYTTDNRPVAVIDEDILDGVPKSQWVQTVKNTIAKNFSGGIPISGRLIKVNKITRSEYTNSKYSKYLKSSDGTIYHDKLKTANNLDDIVLSSTNYINEDLKHIRKDSFKEFARGDVLIRVGGNDYSAKVIVGFTNSQQMVLYDVVDFTQTSFKIKERTSPTAMQNAGSDRNVMPSDITVPQKAQSVNTSISEKDAFSDVLVSNDPKRYAQGEHQLNVSNESIYNFETDVKQKQSDIIPENDDVKQMERENLESYTETQYNDFGWVRYNDILSAKEYSALLSRYADYKHNKNHYPTTRFGEAVIFSFDYTNILMYVKGAIRSPQITKVLTIDSELPLITQGTIQKEILSNERKQLLFPYETVTDFFGEGCFVINKKRDFSSFQEYKRRSKREFSGEDNTYHRNKQNGTRDGKTSETFDELEYIKRSDRDTLGNTLTETQQEGITDRYLNIRAEKNTVSEGDVKMSLREIAGIEEFDKQTLNNIKMRKGIVINTMTELEQHIEKALARSGKQNLYFGIISNNTKNKISKDVNAQVFKDKPYSFVICYDDIIHISEHFGTDSSVIANEIIRLYDIIKNYDTVELVIEKNTKKLVFDKAYSDYDYRTVEIASNSKSTLDLVTLFITKNNIKRRGRSSSPVTNYSDSQRGSTSSVYNIPQTSPKSQEKFFDRDTLGNTLTEAQQEGITDRYLNMRAVKNTTSEGDVKYMSRDEGDTSIKEQIKANQALLNSMDIVASVQEFKIFMNKQNALDWVLKRLENTGYKVNRKGFGEIIIDQKRLKNGLSYLKTNEEMLAFAVLLQVLAKGVEIDAHIQHKGRAYNTVTFAAPVIINGQRGNMAAVVRQEGKNYYKVHRLLMPDGSQLILNNKRDIAETAGGVKDNSGLSPTDNISMGSIPQTSQKSQEKQSGRDTLGNTLTESQQSYFADSKVRDENIPVFDSIKLAEYNWMKDKSYAINTNHAMQQEGITDRYLNMRAEKNTFSEGDVKNSFRNSKSGMANDLLLPYDNELSELIEKRGDYIIDSFEKLKDVVNLAFDKPQLKATAYFGIIPAETLSEIEKSIPNIPKELNGTLFKDGKTYSVAATLDSIKHLADDKNLSRKDIIEYLDRMADTIIDFDTVNFDYYYQGSNKSNGVIFKKTFEDGTMRSFEIVSNKKKTLNLQTLYMESGDYQKNKSAETLLMKNSSANAQGAGRSDSVDSIPQTSQKSQEKFFDRDTLGNTLTEAQQSYFADSKVRDENGNLKVMYHGTPNATFTIFKSGTYFTENKRYSDNYQNQDASSLSYKNTADNPDTNAVYLNIKKPFDTRNEAEKDIFYNEYYGQRGTGTDLMKSGLPNWLEGQDLREFLEEKGYDYDGLILDEGGVGGYGDKIISRGLAYVVFNPEQVININNTISASDTDIRYSDRDIFTYKEYNRLIYKKPIKVSKQDWAKVNSRRTQKYAHISDENVPVLDLIKLAEYNRINEAYGYVIRNNDKYSFNIVSKRKIKSEFNGIYKEESKSNEKTYSQNDRNGNREGFNRRSSEPPRYGGTIRENVSEIRQSSGSEYDSDFGYGAFDSGRGIGLSTQGHMQAVDNDNITGQNNFAENGGGGKYSFAGYAEDGKGMYKSNFPKGTPKIAKAQRILSYIQDVWSKKPIKLNITDNEGSIIKTIDAQFDPTYENDTKIVTDASKLMGDNRHGSASEQRVTLDLADNYYQIASESKYNYSKSETGKNKPTHDGVKEWHYFVNDIYFAEYNSNVYEPYTVSINVKEKPDGNFVYSFSAEKQKENSTQQTLHAVVSEENPANAKLFEDIISEDDMSVNTSISENDSVYSDSFINRETYYEKLRSRQAFNVDLSQIEERYWDTYEKAAESGVLNNTKRTHEFVDMIAKISADKGVPFDFVNNEKIANSSFAAEDKIVNGYLDENGNIVINIESPKALESTVGHEITHILEGTELYETLEIVITEYAKQKGEYEDRLAALTELYKNVEGTDVNKELVADLVGDYLFTDKDFVRRLFNEHRNIFEKIFDEIKYLLRIVTAGSKEARQIEKVKRAFEDVYRESGKVQKNTADEGVVSYSIGFSEENNTSETQQILSLINNSMEKISDKQVFNVAYDNGIENFSKKTDYVMKVFNEQENIAHNSVIGDVELSKSGAKSTIMHGFGREKLAAIKAIKPVIENGEVISKVTNYNNTDVDRYIIAAKGVINGEKAIVGVVVKSYPSKIGNSKFYLHEAEIIKTGSPVMTAPQLSVDTVSKSVSDNTVPQKAQSVNTSISENDSVYSDSFINRETYYEKLRSRQAFNVDLSRIEERYWDTYEKAAESGVLNNTKRTHEFVDMIAKISADKGVPFDFVNNEKIANSSFAAEDKIVNGYLDENGNIVINIESPKALESTVGHEITHILEGTEFYETLEIVITEYAKQKGEYEDRLAALTELYKNVEGADVNKELVADLVGDYLFTDKDFVRRLFNEHRNIFEKIFDEIKYLLRIVTAGSKEARQIEKVKKAFEDAYRESGNSRKNTAENSVERYSLTIKHTDGSVEKLADARNLTDEQAINYLYQAKRGELQGHTYIPVRKDTPQVVIDTLKAVGYEVNNLSMIMQVRKAQQAMSEKSKGGKTVKHGSNIRDHALTAEEVVEIVNNLDNPNMMILQTNRQGKNGTQLPNNVVVFVGYGNNSKEGTAVIEFEGSIDPEYIGTEFGETDYHTVVTVFKPDIERNGESFDYAEELLLNPNNFELKIEKRQPTGSVTREKHPNTSSEFPFFNESVPQTETDVKQKQLDIIPENDDVQQMGRGNLESYTETQYNDFGWVRYNDILSAKEYSALLSRYADYKHNKDNYPTTRFGAAVIYSYDYPNILMYVKGTIKNPQITKIFKTKDSLSPEMQSEIQEEILHNERRHLPFPYETIIDFYGEEVFSILKARNYETFRQIKSRAKGESGKGSNTVSEIKQNGTRGGITSKTTDKSERIKNSDRDSLGDALTETQQSYFADSKVRDENIPVFDSIKLVENVNDSKYNENSPLSFENRANENSRSSINWVYKAKIFSQVENKLFHQKISEINQDSDAFSKNSVGEYMLPIENKIVFTDGNYDSPCISEILEVLTDYSTDFEKIKERILNVERGKSDKEKEGRIIRQMFGEGFVISYRSEVDGVYEWESGKRKGKTRRTVISNYLRKQDGERNGTESKETSIKFSDRNNYWYPNMSKSEIDYVRRIVKHELYTTDNYIDNDNKWLYNEKNGNTYFALYSTADANEPTALYASKGKRAEIEQQYLSNYLKKEVDVNGNIHTETGTVDRLLMGGKNTSGNGFVDSRNSMGGRSNRGDATVYSNNSRIGPGEALLDCLRNIREIQERNERNRVVQYSNRYNNSVDENYLSENNEDRANNQGELVNDYYYALNKSEWVMFYKKLARQGYLAKNTIGSTAFIVINDKLVIAQRQYTYENSNDYVVTDVYKLFTEDGDNYTLSLLKDELMKGNIDNDQRRIYSFVDKVSKIDGRKEFLARYERNDYTFADAVGTLRKKKDAAGIYRNGQDEFDGERVSPQDKSDVSKGKESRTDEFRGLQAESQRMSDEDSQLYHSGERRIDNEIRRRLSRAFRLELRPTNSKRNYSVRTLLNPKTNNNVNIIEGVDGSLFRDIFEISRKYLKNGELVDLREIKTTNDGIGYNDCYNYLSEDGLSGFSITPNGDLISVFNLSAERGFLKTIVPIVTEKAKTLDCYASPKQNLMTMYERIFGFKTASIMDYNMEYDHDNIAKNHNKPQVAFMVNSDADIKTRHFTETQYDEAKGYRDSFVNQEVDIGDNIKNKFTNEKIDFANDAEYNNERGENYVRTDEFRNLQAESQGMSAEDIQLYHSGDKQIDERLRRRFSNSVESIFLGAYDNGISYAEGLVNLTALNNNFRIYKGVNGSLFHDVFEIARKYLKFGELVDLHSVKTTEDGIGYNDCYNYLSEDGLSGFSITPDGDLISVFNAGGKHGFLRAIAPVVKEKVKTLDCYASQKQNLMGMYEKIFGFKTASIMDYNLYFDHDDIARNHSMPQIAFLVNTKSNVETRHFTKYEYNEAAAYRNSFINDNSRPIINKLTGEELDTKTYRALERLNNSQDVTADEIESVSKASSADDAFFDEKNYSLSYAFNSNQIKSVANAKPTIDSDIRYSLSDISSTKRKPIISKLTNREISEQTYVTLDKLGRGEAVALEELDALPEVKEGKEKVKEYIAKFLEDHPEFKDVPLKELGTYLIDSAEREQLRSKILQDRLKSGSFTGLDNDGNEVYNGGVEKGKRLDIVIGLPAAGKSTSIVLPLSQYYKSVVVDSDIIKQELPEFNEGWGASLVHEESSALNLRMLGEELAFGNNIVLPIVCAKTSSIEKYLELAKNKGYDVHLHLNELKSSKAMGRMLGRYFSQGRFIPPAVSYKYGDKPTAIYEEMKNRSDLSGYSHWNNDVAKGQRPTLTDVSGNNRALAAFSRTWRAVRGTDAQRNDSESQSRKSQPNEIATIKETSSADDVFFDREPKYSIPLKYDFDSTVSIGTRKNLNTKISSDDIKYIENICKNLGRKVVFDDLRNISDANGNIISPDGYIKDGVIYINLYAENPIGFVLKHEITHFGEKTEEYKEFVSRVKKSKIYENWLEEKTGESNLKIAEYIYKKRVVSSQSEISRINDPKAEAELIADFAGDMLFTDNGSGMTAIISEVEVKHRNAFVQFILDLISYIKKKLSGKGFIDFQLSVLEDSYNRMISEATDLERNGVYSYDNQISYCFALCKDQSKIELAEQMEADGEDYKTIFSETGLIRDAFGVWLFELDTRHFTIYPEGNAGTEKHFYNNQLKWRNGMLECTLNDIIVYRELYQNYPELRNLKVILQDSYNADDTLKYIPTREALVINKKFFDDYENNKDEIKAEMLGALQTAVQHLDGRSSNISLEKLKVLEEKDQLPYTDLYNRKFTAEEANDYIYDNYEVRMVEERQRTKDLLLKRHSVSEIKDMYEYKPTIDYDNIIVPFENDSVVTLKGKEKIEKRRYFSDVVDRLINGENIDTEVINSIEEVADLNKECLSRPETYTINTEAREKIRLGIFKKLLKNGSAVIDNSGNVDYNGEIRQDFHADIVIGLPASNSAEALVNSLSNTYSSRVAEADIVKEWVPEYDDGLGSKAVDIESRNIADEVMRYAAENSENIVYRVIGEDYSQLVQRIKFLKEKGYSVYLHLDEISNRESLGRSLKKYIDTGEFTPTETILEYGNKPAENFDRIINDERLVDGYSHSTNYELNNELPKLIKNSKEIQPNIEIERADSSIEPASSFEGKKITVNSSFKNALEKAKTTNVLRKFLTYVQYHSKKDISGKQNIRAGSDDLIANVAKNAKQAAGYFNTQKINELSKREISEFDQVGRKFDDNILQKFKDTFFKNEKGQLVSLYALTMRGFGGFKRSQLGLVAGTLESVLETYDREMKKRTQKLTPSIIEIKVNMTNPLKLPFTPENFTAQELLPYLLEKGIISQYDYNRISNLDGAKAKLKYDGHVSTIIRGYIENAGYDGILYFNNTTDMGSMSAVIFNEDQIVKVAKNGVLIKGNGITEDYFDLDSIEESNSAESNAERLKYYISDSKFNRRASRSRADERIRLGNSGFMEQTETDAQKAKQAIEENLKGKSSLELSGKDLAERDIGDTVQAICNSTVFKDKHGNLLSFFKHDTSIVNVAKMIKKGIPFLTFDSALREWIVRKEKSHLTKYGMMQEFYINSVNPFVMTGNEWNSQKVADLLLKEGKITQKYYSELFYKTATKMTIDGAVGQKLVDSLIMKGYDSIILVNDMGETMVIVFDENQIIPVSRNGMLAEENGIIQIDENAEIFDENYIKSVVIDSERKIDVQTEKLKKELATATDNTQKMKILTEFLMCKGQPKLENSEGIIAGHSGAFESCEPNKWSLITIIGKLKERAALNIPTADTDNAGRKIVKGIRDALDGSILKDKNGRPYSFFCYNTHGEFRFNHSQFGLCLSSLKATHEMSLAERTKHPNTVKAAIEEGYAIVKNPYTINFEPENLTPALLAEYMYNESVITEKQYKSVLSRVGADRATYNSHASLFLIEILMSKGFDSISFENESYDPGSKSVILFNESQFIPIASNGLPMENSYSLSNSESGSKNVEKSREVGIDLSEDSGYNIKKKKKYAHHRPRYIENFKEMVLYICRDPITGLVYDPTGVVIDEEKYETFEMGHRPGQEYRKMHEKYMNDEMTDEEFEAWYNDPANYRVELVSTNRSHKFESHI